MNPCPDAGVSLAVSLWAVLVSRHDSRILECLKGCESPVSAVVMELESQDHGEV